MSGLKRIGWLAGGLAGALMASVAQADVITVLPDIRSELSDASPQADNAGVDRLTFATLVIGRMSTMTHTECAVVIFSLRTIPLGMEVDTASLVFLATKSNATFNVDLYGLGLRDDATVSTSDYSAPGELIKAAALQKDTTYSANSPTTITGPALTSYINNQITSTISNGYLFLRFSADAPVTDTQYYQVSSGNIATNWMALRLTLRNSSPVPEPGTLALLGAGLLLSRRRPSRR